MPLTAPAPPQRAQNATTGLRLNLGCGMRPQPGFVNVDVEPACSPDVVCDLEERPWPFADDSVVEVRMAHVLEHLGQDPSVFLGIFQELYRVCRHDATVDIRVPHPRHDAFLADPTHVRPVTLDTLAMFSRRQCMRWQRAGYANTPLALYLDVDFEVVATELVLSPRWQTRLDRGEVDDAAVKEAARSQLNVVEEIRATLRVCKDSPLALARRCLASGDPSGCVDAALAGVDADPEDAALWHVLGAGMLRQGQLEGAELGFRRALALAPEKPDYWADLTVALRQRGALDEAMGAVRMALDLASEHPTARSHLAGLLAESGDYAQAVETSARLVDDYPDNPGFRTNHGTFLRQAGQAHAALLHLRAAHAAAPAHPSTAWNLALGLFQAGRYREAFPLAEARYRREGVDTPPWADRMWDGTPAPGATLLLETEQGFGDALQFVRFAEQAARGGAHVVVRAPARLVPLLSTAPGVAAVVPREQEVDYDHIAYLMSVPARLGLGRDDVRRAGAYLRADPSRASRLLQTLPEAHEGRVRIGVAWQGNPDHERDRHRSFPLRALAPIAALPGVVLVSLQRGPGAEQREEAGFSVHELPADLDADGAFLDTAALLDQLDAVIACDSAVAHLAGALHRPCLLALDAAPDWRWEQDAPTTPWYARHTLFRQPTDRAGDWAIVFEAMAAHLRGVHGL